MNRKKLHPALKREIAVRSGLTGIERPAALLEKIPEDAAPLMQLSNHHIVSARQFNYDNLVQLCRLAAYYETLPHIIHKPLNGKIMIAAFYEPSTRTRSSFESAWHRLGGDIISITDAKTTGLTKGESLQDIAEMFNNYGDVIVLRDKNESSVYDMLESLRIPIINAGNGIDEHPTQALADIYTIIKWRPELLDGEMPEDRKIHVGVIGTPGKMRTVRSLLLMLTHFGRGIKQVTVVNPHPEIFDKGQKEELQEAGLNVRVARKLKDVLPGLDAVYINSIAWIGDTYETLTGDMKLSASSPLKPESIILHPLARGDELDPDLDKTSHNWYFAQARGAVFVRMALLTTLVERINLVIDAPAPVLEE